MCADSKRLEAQISDVQNRIGNLPEGRIFCTHDGQLHKWYHSLGEKQTYISKRKNRQLAEQLAEKKYLSLLLQDLIQEKKAIDGYLQHYKNGPGQVDQMLLKQPEYQELLSSYFKPLSQELHEWATSPYDHDAPHSENLILKTVSGNMVRSKSEELIDMILYMHKIPFRYECALMLGSNKIYPDFTIRHPKTGETYYWEHFGMMDDPEYRFDTGYKLRQYINNGIIPTYQLITTYETKDRPLSSDVVEKIVKNYFED